MAKSRVPSVLSAVGALLAAFVFAVIVTAGANQWIPAGRAGVDHIVIPIVVFPLIWVTFAVMLFAARSRGRAWAIVGGVTATHVALIIRSFTV